MVGATGTSTLGLIVWVLLLGFVGWLFRRAYAWKRLRKENIAGIQAFRQSFRQGYRDAFIGVGAFALISLAAWVACIPFVVYKDHQHLVHLIQDFQNRPPVVKQLQAQLAATQTQAKQNDQRANYWRDAFIAISKGEMVPDRLLSVENTDRLHNKLEELVKASHDPKFITTSIAPAFYEDDESAHLASQLLRVFKDSGWKAKWEVSRPELSKLRLNSSIPVGIVIFTDDPHNQGDWLMQMLKDVGLETYVAPDTPEGFKGTFICVGYKQGLRPVVP